MNKPTMGLPLGAALEVLDGAFSIPTPKEG